MLVQAKTRLTYSMVDTKDGFSKTACSSGVCLPFGCLPTFRVFAYLSRVCLPFGCLPTFRVLVLLAGVSLAQRGAQGPHVPLGPWGPYKEKVCVVKIGAQTEKNNRNLICVLHISLKLTFSTDDKHFLCCI